MSFATLATVQDLAKARLSANTTFAGLAIFSELDENATPDQLAQFEKDFDTALLTKGVAVVVTCPELQAIDKVNDAAVSTELGVTIAICENPEVNRGEVDLEANPPRSPAKKSGRTLLEAAIVALLPEFRFPPQPVGRAEWETGFWVYYLVAHKKHVIRAASPA